MGRPPQQEVDYPFRELPGVPPLPETGIPVELIRRRPDVQTAFNLLQAADRELAAAISNRYPRVSFSLSYSTAVNDTDKLFKDWAYSLAGNLLAPIFYGGELKAEVNRTEAVKQQRLYEYGQTVLIAFQEVEDALIQEEKQIESIQLIEEQVQLARQTIDQLRLEYLNGLSDYLDVLTALDQEQELRRDLLSAKLTLLEYRIALYRALAGGFETERENME
jgi:outer membrane protein TolC